MGLTIGFLVLIGMLFLLIGMIFEKEWFFWAGVFLLGVGIVMGISVCGLPV